MSLRRDRPLAPGGLGLTSISRAIRHGYAGIDDGEFYPLVTVNVKNTGNPSYSGVTSSPTAYVAGVWVAAVRLGIRYALAADALDLGMTDVTAGCGGTVLLPVPPRWCYRGTDAGCQTMRDRETGNQMNRRPFMLCVF
jgi:hypothetical protein